VLLLAAGVALICALVTAVVVYGLPLLATDAAPLPDHAFPDTPLPSVQAAATWSPPQPAGPATITIAAVGDMIFDRQVASLIAREGGEAPLAVVADRLSAADVTIGNLESPLSDRGTRRDKDYTFRGDPEGVAGLRAAGFDLLSLANNHALDYGEVALQDTIALLDDAGIAHAGAGMDRASAWRPAVLTLGRTTVAYLAFTHVLPPGFIAGSSRPGVAQGRGAMDSVEEAVRTAAAEHDYVIVSFHWGVEYEDHATAEQIADAHRVVDAGADMVLAHHPHVIQALETYRGALIAYSLGDFVFDHYSRKTGEAFVLEASLGPAGVSDATVVPVYLDRYGRPEYVDGQDAQAILTRLRDISARRGCTIRIDDDIGRVLFE
jgi:poly-gamma-glutamate synthesis protein (capsule biosynthesis protein)